MRSNLSTQAQDELKRALEISLLTWARAPDDSRYGWWGDSYPRVANDVIGSRLWQLQQRTLTQTTMHEAQADIEQALQWLIDDGVAQSLAIQLERIEAGLVCTAEIHLTATLSLTHAINLNIFTNS